MGLRCSILGHTFGETEVRRDRRERGENEVVTVVAQVERCSRCGTERVVSENKEVVSVVDADEVDLDGPGAGAAGSGADPSASTDPDVGTGSTPGTEGTVPQGGDDDPEAASPADAGTETGAEARTDERSETEHGTNAGRDPAPAADPSEEDVEFITETEGSLGGGDEVTEDVPADVEGGIGGMAARSGAFGGDDESSDPDEKGESAGEDAEILDAPETERAPGQWPDEPDTDDPWEPDALDEEEGDSRTDPEPEVEPVAEPSFTVPKGSLRCQNCGNEVSADSSFRAGDACPECQTGYLEASEET